MISTSLIVHCAVIFVKWKEHSLSTIVRVYWQFTLSTEGYLNNLYSYFKSQKQKYRVFFSNFHEGFTLTANTHFH